MASSQISVPGIGEERCIKLIKQIPLGSQEWLKTVNGKTVTITRMATIAEKKVFFLSDGSRSQSAWFPNDHKNRLRSVRPYEKLEKTGKGFLAEIIQTFESFEMYCFQYEKELKLLLQHIGNNLVKLLTCIIFSVLPCHNVGTEHSNGSRQFL